MRDLFVIIAIGIGLIAGSLLLFDADPTSECESDGTTTVCAE